MKTAPTLRRLAIAAACATFLTAQRPRPAAAAGGPIGYFQNFSQIVPQVPTDLWGYVGAYKQRFRIVAIDSNVQADSTGTVAATIWCAWGTAAANPAAIGTNGFPLNPGFDDTDIVAQGPMNCVQAAGQTHFARLEIY